MISVAIIAKNAANTLGTAIQSVKPISDDVVVVVDASSGDETDRVAKNLGASVWVRQFDNFADQKNYAVGKCRHDWVLALDADEEVSAELAAEIETAVVDSKPNGYYIPRLNYIFKKPIWHSNWDPRADSHIWLFRKSRAKWVGAVHEEVQVNGTVGRLSGMKHHYNYVTAEQFITKMNLYTSLEKTATNPLYDFLRRYVWHLGFLDGYHGLFLSYLMLVSHLSTGVKLWLKKKQS